MADPTGVDQGLDSRSASSASNFGADARGKSTTPMSIDPRSPTPLLRYGVGLSSSASTEDTPTPQQWAREYGDRNGRCATALGGPIHETRQESTQRAKSSLGHASQPFQTKEADEDPPSEDDEKEEDMAFTAVSTTVGFRSTVAGEEGSADFLATFAQGSTDGTLVRRESGPEMPSFPASPSSVRSPSPQYDKRKSLAFSYRAIAECTTDVVNGASLDLRKGMKPRGMRFPSSAPPKMGPPRVIPHNTWRTLVEWVPPAGSHEDPDFSYALNCRMDGSKHVLLLDDLGTAPQVQFDHLEAGQVYYFQVCARNNLGYSEWSNFSEGYLVPESPPSAPYRRASSGSTALVAAKDGRPRHSSESPTSAMLEWDEPCDQGSEIMGYRIQYALDIADPESFESTSVLGRQNWVHVTNLLPNRVYYFRTQAVNKVGESDWTSWSEGIATKAVEPEAPDPPVLLEAQTTELIVQWRPPYSCGFRITQYSVRISKKDPTMSNALLLPMDEDAEAVDACKLRVVDIEPNTDYYFQVRAQSEMGTSEWSYPSLPMRTHMALPGAPEDVRVVDCSFRLVTVEWVTPDGYGEPIDGFVVRWLDAIHPFREHDRIQVPAFQPEVGTVVAVQVKGVVPGSRLNFQVAARTVAGLGPFSKKSPDIVAAAGVPGPPPRPTVALRTTTSMQITVDETHEDNGDSIVRYEARWDTNAAFTNPVSIMGEMQMVPRQSPGLPRRFTIAATGLRRRGPYYFSVRAFNRVGPSAWSLGSEGQILHLDGPSKMSAPHLVKSLPNGLLVGYTPSAEMGIFKGGGLHEFEMRYTRWPELLEQNTDDDASPEADPAQSKVRFMRWTAPAFGASSPEPRLVEGLLAGRSYYFQARCVSDFGAGPWSYVSLPFEVVPGVPDKPTAPGVDKGTDSPYSIQLAMMLPEPNGRAITSCSLMIKGPTWADRPEVVAEWKELYTIGTGDIDLHRQRRPHVEDSTEPDFMVSWTHTVIYLEPGAYYQFMFSCSNCMGDSQWSEASVPMSTAPTVPNQCEAPSLEQDSDRTPHTLAVRWKPPHNGGSDLMHYTVQWATNPNFQGHKVADFVPEAKILLQNLSPYQWYYVKVAASNAIGQGKFSDLNSAMNIGCFITRACVPKPVQNINAELTEHEEVIVRWNKPSCTGGHIITRYKVTASRTRDFQSIEQEVVQKSVRECTFLNLAPDTVFYFEVRAGNSLGYSEPSGNPAYVQMRAVPKNKEMPPRIPDAPDCSLVAEDRGRPRIQVKWLCPELYHPTRGFTYKAGVQTHMILSYNVKLMSGDPADESHEQEQVREGLKQIRDRRTVPKDEPNHVTFDNILLGRHYTASVQAVNEFHCSEWSPASQGLWSTAGIPNAPRSLICVGRQHTSLMLSWRCPLGNGEDVTAFQVRWKGKRYHGPNSEEGIRRSSQMSALMESSKIAADETSSTIADSSANDWSDMSGDEDGLPGPNLSSSTSPGSRSRDEEDGVRLQLMDVMYGEKPVLDNNPFAPRGRLYDGQECRWELKGLMPGRYYVFEVRAMNTVGFGPWMSSEILRTSPQEPQPPRSCKGVPGSTKSSVTFTWEAPADDGGEKVEGYEVRWTNIDYVAQTSTVDPSYIFNYDTMRERCDLGPNHRTYTAQGLLPGQVALPVVRCWNMVGYSTWCRLPEGSVELKALSTLPDVPSPIKSSPMLSKRPAKDHRPYGLSARWYCPKINGCPIKAFLVRFQQPKPLAPGLANAATGPGKDYKEVTLEYDGSGAGWCDGELISLDFVHEDLVAGMPYIFHARGCSDIGWCEDWGMGSLPELAPPNYPLQPAPPVSAWQWPTAIELQWFEPCMSGATLSRVDVRYSRNRTMTPLLQAIPDEFDRAVAEKDDKAVVGDLPYSTAFFFQLRMENEVGWSPWSVVSPPFVTKACRPAPPSGLALVNMQQEMATVTWEVSDDHGAAIGSYDLILADFTLVPNFEAFMDKVNASVSEKDADALLKTIELKSSALRTVESFTDANAPEHCFDGLQGGKTYWATVRARNSEGASDYSPVLSMTTAIMSPDKCPQLVLLEAGQTSLLVEYCLPYDNGDTITSLEFFWIFTDGPRERHMTARSCMLGMPALPPSDESGAREVAHGTVIVEFPPPDPAPARGQVVIQGLEPGAQYNLQVRAENACGQGPFSEAVCMLCSPGRPDAPDRVRPGLLPRSPLPSDRSLPFLTDWADEESPRMWPSLEVVGGRRRCWPTAKLTSLPTSLQALEADAIDQNKKYGGMMMIGNSPRSAAKSLQQDYLRYPTKPSKEIPTVFFEKTGKLQRDEVVTIRSKPSSSIFNALGWRSSASSDVTRIVPSD